MNYLDYCDTVDLTVREAMRKLDRIKPKVIFLLENLKLVASLTDGDIRRFLLNGGSISDRAVRAGNHSPLLAYSRQEAATLYNNKNYIAIPIMNDCREVIDIYVGDEQADDDPIHLNVPVVINAGGKGTRLEPYTKILPKPLIPIDDDPVIEHIMRRFQIYGCSKFHIIANYKKNILKAYFADCEQEYDIAWYDEIEPLGTGGGLCYLKGKVDSTFFFTNCDNLLLADYEEILQFHRNSGNLITMIGAYKNLTIPYGVVEMGKNGNITSMQEKPELSFLVNTGIYIVEPEVLDDIEENTPIGFPDIVEKERKKGNKVAIYPISDNDWLDMGQFSELENMKKRINVIK